GSAREAQELYESLLPDLARRGAPAEFAAALSALSQLATAQGEYDRAAARGAEAAGAYRALGDRGGESRALNAIALAEVYRGDYRQALGHLDEALVLARAVGDREAEVEQLNNRGSALFLQARYLDALRAYRAAEERVERAAGEAWQARRRRLTLANLAALFQRLGAYDEALDLHRQLQASPEALGASEQARALINLGVLYRRLEDPWKALETYSAAQRLFARDQHRDGEIKVLKNIGIVQALDLADLPAALDAFTRALGLAEQNHDRREAMQARLYRGEALLRLGEAEAARRELEGALRAAEELGTAEERWKALYALGRAAREGGHDDLAAARFRDAIAVVESMRATLQLSALRNDFLADKRDVYDALVDLLALRPAPDAVEVFELLERSRARTFQDRVQQRADARDATPARLAAVQARLDPRTLLVEYWATPAAAAAVWTTRDESGVVRIPVPAGARDDISAFAREVSAGTGEAWRRTSRLLGERLLSGIAPLRRPALRHLIVVPDGALSAVPFEALELPGGDGALLVERFDVAYVPSASILLREAPGARRSWSFPWTRHLLAFGDPVVSEASAGALAEALGGEVREPLPASADEVRSIAAMEDGRAEVHLGPANRKRYLLDGHARGVPVVHLGTHATTDEANPERSRILFSPDGDDRPADYLFLKEVYDLDLQGVDLATLSACDTERGKVLRGEGLQAFSRALLSAGARAAVTSLWRVADRPTAEFMKQFYFELDQLEPKAEALRLAKLRFLHSASELRHPRFWAAFVMNGDGTRPVPRVLAWERLLAPLPLLLLAAAAWVGRRRAATR
ncbi:MAG TPA: CHAT domain-containing tetratricopeptide repeat protein, partial [Anaeromyxobacteraceae bacterium]|nr:CHAT domain-containing tetratricopeptide repeat protein [Anaeromyxobacteraceae bacterium]